MNLDGQDLTISSSQVALLSCDLSSHAMPEGLAIVSAMMRVRTLQQSGISLSSIPMTMYESSEHDWDESQRHGIRPMVPHLGTHPVPVELSVSKL